MLKTAVAVERERGFVHPGDHRTKLNALINRGWDHLYVPVFGEQAIDGLASHHIEAIQWHWESRLDLLNGRKPTYDAYFPIRSRGHAKSGIARRLAIVDGLLSYAYSQPGYNLYLSRNKDMALKHSKSVETLLQSKRVQTVCEPLAKEQVNEQKRSKGWTAKFLYTGANIIYHFAGLDEGLAGANLETNASEGSENDDQTAVRITFFVLDDIDGRDESPVIAQSRFNTLTTEILPMGQVNTLTFFAQNLINRHSTMYRIHSQQVKVLTGRKPTEPIKAVIDFKSEQITNKDGIIQDIFVSGTPTWNVWDKDRVQLEINRFGLKAFLTECQHEVKKKMDGVILHNYDDDVHVISESEFNAVYGSTAWLSWRKKLGNDWARTKTDKHANVAAWLTQSPVDTAKPNFSFIRYAMSFPANSAPEDVAERALTCLTPYAYDTVTWQALRNDILNRANVRAYAKTVMELQDMERGELKRVIPKYARPLLQRCNVQQGDMSHEQDTVRKIYSGIYSLIMRPANPGKYGGIDNIISDMRIDKEQPHAFRVGQMGYTQWYIVAPDDLTREYADGVYMPKPYPLEINTETLEDSDLLRFQITNWSMRPAKQTESGETIDEPEKMYDDFCNMLQFFATGAPLSGSSLSTEQRIDLLIPESVKEMQAAAVTSMDKTMALLTMDFEREAAENKLGITQDQWSEWE